MNELPTDGKNQISNFVDVSVNSVCANMMTVTDDVIKTVRTKEVKKKLDLLSRRKTTVSLCFMLKLIMESFFQVINN
jgi:hypothetical protein